MAKENTNLSEIIKNLNDKLNPLKIENNKLEN